MGEPLLRLWEALPLDPEGQLQAAREYAAHVLGDELSAMAWLGRTDHRILEGSCVISEACRSRQGFRETVLELSRIKRN